MKKISTIAILVFFLFTGCKEMTSKKDFSDVWKNNPQQINTESDAHAEIAEKLLRVQKFLKEQKLEGVLLTQVRNVYWMTAGLANSQIVLNKDVGAASLLIMKDGSKYVLCSGSESDRLMDEVLGKLGYRLKMYNWYESNPLRDVRGEIIKTIAREGKIGSDVDYPGTILVAGAFKPLRYSLTTWEINRYRWLGKQTTEAVAEVCRAFVPGMDDFQIEAMTAAALRSRGILPTVLLIGVDERIFKYRHALPGGAALKKYAMVNVVAEKWGMPIAVTRFVHFGPLEEELKAKLAKTAKINAEYEAATVPGTSGADIFERCKKWYADAGYANEWQKHHQGGAIGYDDRDYVIYPGVKETVQEAQAFAWNPTITGAKVEDTMIAFKDHIEVVTVSAGWPMIPVELNGIRYPQPDILVR